MIRRLRARWQRDLALEPRLAWVGALLAFAELLCAARLWQVHADRMLARGGEPLCWPIWSTCSNARVLDQWMLTALLALVTLMAMIAGVAFLRRSRWAMPVLVATMVLLLAFELQDFRLRQNQFYMLAIAVAAFTLLPERGRVLRHLVVQFYFWAGLLKLNKEWLSGAALYRPFGVDGTLLRIGCAWVVVLELVMIFGMLSRRRWLFIATIVQLALFSIASIAEVGPFYPALMMVLIAACTVLRRQPEPPLWIWRERWSTRIAIAIFCALQFIPRLMPGDSAVTGEGRMFALHMFDAHVVCESTATVRDATKVVQVLDASRGLPVRIACDPAVLYARGRSLCARVDQHFTVDLHLASRHSSEPQLRSVVELNDFCRNMPEYHWWWHNDWIRP